MKVEMPYGPRDRIPVEVPDSMLAGVLKPAELNPASDPLDVVRRALRRPTGRGRLRDDPRVRWAARLGDKVAIVISDASRPPVERWVVPALLEELREAGVDERQVTVFVGTGSHRPATPDEIAEKLGPELARRLRVVNHGIDRSPMRFLGFSRHGHPIVVNREVADSACKIVVGTVLPHPICGYSGHAKGAVIGVGGAPTIASTHTPAMLDDPRVGLGLLDGNPFYETIVDGGRMLGIDFIVNVVCTPDGAIVDAEAGDMVAAHRALVERTARPAFEATFSERADIVLVSAGHPKDHNLYHIAAEALAVVAGEAAPTPCVKDEGGTIIVVSPIEEGAYSTGFYQRMVQGGSPQGVLELTRREGIVAPGQHRAASTARILLKHRVVLAGSRLDDALVRSVYMEPASSPQAALDEAIRRHGPSARILAVLHSHRLVPVYRPAAERPAE